MRAESEWGKRNHSSGRISIPKVKQMTCTKIDLENLLLARFAISGSSSAETSLVRRLT